MAPNFQTWITSPIQIQFGKLKYEFHTKFNNLCKYKICFLFWIIKIDSKIKTCLIHSNFEKFITCSNLIQFEHIKYVFHSKLNVLSVYEIISLSSIIKIGENINALLKSLKIQ